MSKKFAKWGNEEVEILKDDGGEYVIIDDEKLYLTPIEIIQEMKENIDNVNEMAKHKRNFERLFTQYKDHQFMEDIYYAVNGCDPDFFIKPENTERVINILEDEIENCNFLRINIDVEFAISCSDFIQNLHKKTNKRINKYTEYLDSCIKWIKFASKEGADGRKSTS